MKYPADWAVFKDVKILLETASETFLDEILINSVIFSFHNNKLNVLILHFEETDYYSLPEGWIFKNETIDDASSRTLHQYIGGLEKFFSEQFYMSGGNERSDNGIVSKALEIIGYKVPENHWLTNRKVSICYYSLISKSMTDLVTNDLIIGNAIWVDVQKLPKLVNDHGNIIQKAILKMQEDIDKKPIAYNLLNKTFTLNELQSLYEAVFQKKFVRANFQRKILCSNTLIRLDKLYNGKSHRAPYLYRFKNNTK